MISEAGSRKHQAHGLALQQPESWDALVQSLVEGVLGLIRALEERMELHVREAVTDAVRRVAAGLMEDPTPARCDDGESSIPVGQPLMERPVASGRDTTPEAPEPQSAALQAATGTVPLKGRRAAAGRSTAAGDTLPFPEVAKEAPVAEPVGGLAAGLPWQRVLEGLEGLTAGLNALGVSSAVDAERMAGLLRQFEFGGRPQRASVRQPRPA